MMRNEPFILEVHGLPNHFDFKQARNLVDNAMIPASQWELTLSLSKTPRIYAFFQFLQQMQCYDELLQKTMRKLEIHGQIERIFRFRGIFENVVVAKPQTTQPTEVISRQNATSNNSRVVQNKLADRIKQYDQSYNQKKQEKVKKIQEKSKQEEKKEITKKPKTGKVGAKKPVHVTNQQLSNATHLDQASFDQSNTFITDNKSSRLAIKTLGKAQKRHSRNSSFDVGPHFPHGRGKQMTKGQD